MSGEGSFPHKTPQQEAPNAVASEGEESTARVLEFPTEDASRATPRRDAPSDAPAGTWADEPGDEDVERLLRPAGVERWEGGEVVEFPGPTSTQTRKRPSFVRDPKEPRSEERRIDDSGTQQTQAPEPADADRPKYLASELLKQEWFPRTPLRNTLRWGSVVLGVVGVATAVWLGGLGGNAFGLIALFTLCAVSGVAPLEPELRGSALTLIGATGAVWLGYLSTAGGAGAATPLLIGCITLTVAALLFRAAHRQSNLARLLVALGLLGTGVYLVLSGGLDGMIVESLHWQSWVVPVSRLALATIVLLAVLSFLDPTGHGGAWVAGFAFLAWLALDAAGSAALAAWPMRAPAAALTPERWLVIGALPIFAAVTAGGMCQLLALVSHRLHGK